MRMIVPVLSILVIIISSGCTQTPPSGTFMGAAPVGINITGTPSLGNEFEATFHYYGYVDPDTDVLFRIGIPEAFEILSGNNTQRIGNTIKWTGKQDKDMTMNFRLRATETGVFQIASITCPNWRENEYGGYNCEGGSMGDIYIKVEEGSGAVSHEPFDKSFPVDINPGIWSSVK
ncbi:MAG: hypothetical protein JSV63_03415 [Candidatus Aenigmatarchaeota archaeon]|nr:MAG: hypothetical protein JSV63_03415 [Candidatus Aenigmarchaeota archaeon]